MINLTKEACNEIYDIILHMEQELYNKIPKSFINCIKQNTESEYKTHIDYSKSINEQELLKDTKIILSLIYRDYLCDETERKDIIKQEREELKQREKELREKYNVDNLFNKNVPDNNNDTQNNENQLIKYEDKNFLSRIIYKLKKFFSKKWKN